MNMSMLTTGRWNPFRAVLLVLLFATTQVHAQQSGGVEACAAAYEQAQVTRNEGKLKQAHDHLSICVQDSCPDFVKVDCGQWLSEVKREIPSVIFSAVDSDGGDLVAVTVTLDGRVVTNTLDGIAVGLDPGPHDVTFEFDGQKHEKQLVVRQGEKNRVFRVDFVTSEDSDGDGIADDVDVCPDTPGVAAEEGCVAKAAASLGVNQDIGGDGRVLANVAYVSWGVGAAGLATFAIAGLMSTSLEREAAKKCLTPDGEPTDANENAICENDVKEDYVSRVRQRELFANVGLGVGVTAAVAGTVLFVLSLSDSEPTASNEMPQVGGLTVDAIPTPHGGFMSVSGTF